MMTLSIFFKKINKEFEILENVINDALVLADTYEKRIESKS